MKKSKHTLGIVLCTIFGTLLLIAVFLPNWVVTKAKSTDLTEAAPLTLNSAPEAKAGEHVYTFTESGTNKRYMVYNDSVLNAEIFNALKQGDTVTYRTYKDDSIGLKNIADLGNVTVIVSLAQGETDLVTIGSYNDALSNDLMWLQIVCGVLSGVLFILDGVFIYLRGRNAAKS